MKGNSDLQQKLKGAADADAFAAIAKEAGFAITPEDVQSMQPAKTELSDDDLERVAGGICAATQMDMIFEQDFGI